MIVRKIGDLDMIELTRINGIKFSVNPDLIEVIETTPDTVVTLTTGRKLIIKESRQEVKNIVLSYKRDVYANLLNLG